MVCFSFSLEGNFKHFRGMGVKLQVGARVSENQPMRSQRFKKTVRWIFSFGIVNIPRNRFFFFTKKKRLKDRKDTNRKRSKSSKF